PSDGRSNRPATRRRGQHAPRPSQTQEFLARITGFGIDILIRAQLTGQALLVFATRDGDRPETKAVGELDAKVTKATQTLHRHEIPRFRNAMAQCIEGGDT